MKPFDAIYARQSVDKMDSISIESQIEICRREVIDGTEVKIYQDKGYSGKNTDRPAFQELISDISHGKVRRVIIYRLDRVSRSVLDFANLIELFEQNHVSFVSSTEKFDTGSPMGKAMVFIIMVFAQLERETIQQRVLDAYRSRSARGFYMGGRIPYGFRLVNTVIDGIRTKMYEPVPDEVEVIRTVFTMYSEPQTSFGDITKYLAEKRVLNRNNLYFNRTRIRDLIVNPVYVRADYRIYEFFRSQGTEVENPPEDFIGTNGAYLYSGRDKKRKTVSLEGHKLVLAPHNGIIDSVVWLKCREKCLNNKAVAKPVKAKATWLAGKIKCGHCGYALTAKVYHCKTKSDNRYFLCNNKYNGGGCHFGSLDADVVEEIVYNELCKKLKDFGSLSRHEAESESLQVIQIKHRIEEIDKEVSSLLEKVLLANETVMNYINERIEKLDEEKKTLYNEILQLDAKPSSSVEELTDYMKNWDKLTVSDRISVVDILINRITATKESITIDWKV